MFIIFKRELRANLKSVLIWTLVMALMAGIGFGEYEMVMGEGSEVSFNAVIDMMPHIVKVMFGMSAMPVDTAEGWYVCMFLWCAMIAYLHAALLGAGILSKEERDKTADYLFTKPVTRAAVIYGKVLAAKLYTVIVVTAGWIVTVAAFGPYFKDARLAADINLSMLGMAVTSLLFLFIGLFCSAAAREKGKGTQYSAITVMAAYVLYVVIEAAGNIDFLRFLSPFSHFDAARVFLNGMDWIYMVISAIVAAAAIVGTLRLYGRRDLHN